MYEREAELPKGAVLTKNVRGVANLKLQGADALIALTAARAGLYVYIVSLACTAFHSFYSVVYKQCADWCRIVSIDNGGQVVVNELLSSNAAKKRFTQSVMVENSFRAPGINLEKAEDKLGGIIWLIGLPDSRKGGYVDAAQVPSLMPMSQVCRIA